MLNESRRANGIYIELLLDVVVVVVMVLGTEPMQENDEEVLLVLH